MFNALLQYSVFESTILMRLNCSPKLISRSPLSLPFLHFSSLLPNFPPSAAVPVSVGFFNAPVWFRLTSGFLESGVRVVVDLGDATYSVCCDAMTCCSSSSTSQQCVLICNVDFGSRRDKKETESALRLCKQSSLTSGEEVRRR